MASRWLPYHQASKLKARKFHQILSKLWTLTTVARTQQEPSSRPDDENDLKTGIIASSGYDTPATLPL